MASHDHLAFVPREFPPPALADVPVDYIIDQLHHLAPHYWNKPETADCTIIVPMDSGRTYLLPYPSAFFPASLATPPLSPHDPTGLNRRATEPALQRAPRMAMKLHMDYLSAQSTFLRTLFSGALPLDLINTTSESYDPPSRPSSRASNSSNLFSIPFSRLPRLIPSSPTHPTVYLPLPDSASFPHLVHWMYFGTTHYIDECLGRGLITWEGIVRNVEYLGLRTEIKVFLGRWYGAWAAPELGRPCDSTFGDDDDDDDDDDDIDIDTDVDVESDDGDICDSDSGFEEFHRGRSRTRSRPDFGNGKGTWTPPITRPPATATVHRIHST